MAADKNIQALISTMEKAVADFQKGIPSIQQGLLESLSIQLKDLQLQNGRVLNSVQNLKLIGNLKNKIERLIISKDYQGNVRSFIDAFDHIAELQRKYFADFNYKFKPSKTLPMIRDMAVEKTLNDLLGQGLQVNIIDRLYGILRDNVTSGGSYASITEQVRNHILTNETGDGAMERYSRTITTDAINQYSAQYHEALAQDLNFNWGRYVGSNLTTTREFCEHLTKKEWVHRSELPEILKGHIDGHACKLSKSTGLPLGMIPGTDISNFKIRRGGYNCGHQFFWIPDSVVPDHIKNNKGNPVQQKKKYDINVLNEGGFYNIRNNEFRMNKLENIKSKLDIDEKIAVNGYSDNEYWDLNKYCRGQYSGNKTDYFRNYREILNDAISKIEPPVQQTVFRGARLSSSQIKKYLDAFKANGIVKEEAFTSTSLFISSAFGGNVRFMIKSKSGKFIKEYSEHPTEDEVLFQAGLSYKIVHLEEKDEIYYIKMEEI